MAKTKTAKKATTAEDLGVYISLLTDFGFKRVFGIKKVMLKFLNTVLDISCISKIERFFTPHGLSTSKV